MKTQGFTLWFVLILLCGGPLAWAADVHDEKKTPAQDPRHIESGQSIPDEGYCDQPYVVITKDGHWLCVLTTGEGQEGQRGQHVVSTISKDQGKTWGPLIDIEPADGPEASWVVPLIVPSGRVYAFYTYNGDNINELPGNTRKIRADMLGWYCYKYSDDNGRTWSKDRYRIPVRLTAADRANQWEGKVQVFWGIDKPKISDSGVRFAFTKLGKYMLDNGEGWMLYSDNILAETAPEKINWTLLPDGEHGIRHKAFGSVQEEHNHVPIGDDRLYMVYRTTTGYPCHTYSHDGGHSWSTPEFMTYTPGGRKIKTPRACPKLWRCKNGKYLFWFHNHSGRSFNDRNPAWVAGGVVRHGKMHWSEPEILLYAPLQETRMSYPDLIEQDGKYWISETQKSVARVHEIAPTLLEGMWAQLEGEGRVAKDGLALSLDAKVAKAESVKMPRLPSLSDVDGGFAIDVRLIFKDLEAGQVILDSRNDKGRGVALEVAEQGSIRLTVSDGQNPPAEWTTDPGLLKEGQTHHVTAIVDGGPNIITFVVDGKLCDGGESRQFGWGRFDPKVGDVNGAKTIELSPSFHGKILTLRIYARYLRTSEAVANYQAGVAAGNASKASKAKTGWRRSDPLSAIYLPTQSSKDDRCNQQVVGMVTQADSYLVTWTMASIESKPNQRVAISRSTDKGQNWSKAQIVAGDSKTYPGAASYSWLYQVPKTGRIYCFYLKNDPSVITVRRDITGWLKWQYSDDDGVTWQRVKAKYDMGRGDWTSQDPAVPTSFIGIYAPHVTSWGEVLFSFARYGLKNKGTRDYSNWMTEVYFMRLDNILTETDPEQLQFSILPDSTKGLRIERKNGLFWGNEPSWIELSDGRLMTAIRTRNDAVYYALSSDRGRSWTKPLPLRYSDAGDIVLNPNAPCPMVKLDDGRIVLMYHNAKQSGTFGPRNPIWVTVGKEKLDANQPIQFGKPVKFMEVSGKPPLGSTYVQIATYSSFDVDKDRLVLFYNDCKHWVLFKEVPAKFLTSLIR